MSNVLEVRNLILFRRGRALITPISFSLSIGEIIRVVGENGSGKTTLIEAILGIHREWTGTVQIDSNDISYKRQIVPAFSSLSLSEVAPLLVGFDLSTFNRIREDLRLDYLKDRPIGVLSGGEVQRVMIALALLRQHDLLILDEPFGGVDKESMALIANCILRESASRATMVVEHRASMNLGMVRNLILEDHIY